MSVEHEYRTTHFRFEDSVPAQAVGETMHLAMMAAQILFGPERVAVEARVQFDPATRHAIVSGATEVSRSLAALFLGYAWREFDRDALKVERGQGRAQQ
jgi:hypothetical protein